MLTRDLYYASDQLLTQERRRPRALTHQLKVTHYGNASAYKQILSALLPNAAADIWIEPPFFCDYGYNLYTGKKGFFNFNCVLLDVMPIQIGSNASRNLHIQTDHLFVSIHIMQAKFYHIPPNIP